MLRRFWMKPIFMISVIFLTLFTFSINQVSGQNGFVSESAGKIDTINNLHTATLKKLFAQERKISAIKKAGEGIAREMEALDRQIELLQGSIAQEETAQLHKKDDLRQLLRSYQRMGPGSYLEIILESNDLTDFLQRLNLLRHITRNTGDLIEALQKSKEKQAADKNKLADRRTALEVKGIQFLQALEKERLLKENFEKALASLARERDKYQQYLKDLKYKWDELMPLFSKSIKAFSSILAEEKLPPGALKLSTNFLIIKGSMTDKALNDVIAGNPNFPPMIFRFEPGNAELSMPDKSLVLEGTFEIYEGNSLLLKVKEGRFYGIPLETEVLEELFQESDMVVSFKPLLLRNYTINSVELMKGTIQFTISPGYEGGGITGD